MQSAPKFEVEFSLALNSRTGRYFVCHDMMEAVTDLLGPTRYWRISHSDLPSGILRRVLGRLMDIECRARVDHPVFSCLLPRIRRTAPVLFTEPFHALAYTLKSEDAVICHDMGPITHPDLYDPGVKRLYEEVFSHITKARPHLIFVTQSSRSEYERLLGCAYNTAAVVTPAIRTDSVSGEVQPVESIKLPFLLTVGLLGKRKNQARAIQAYSQSGLAQQGISYVLCGGHEAGAESVIDLADKTPGVRRTGYLKEPQLRWLYANASAFVLPSLLEGFGFPAAEAIANGIIPVISQGGALQEVTGDAAILVDPYEIGSIAAGMQKSLSLTLSEKQLRLQALQLHLSRFGHNNAAASWRAALMRNSVAAEQAKMAAHSVA